MAHGNARRLLTLAVKLESIEEMYFDLGGWGRYDEEKLRVLLTEEMAEDADYGNTGQELVAQNLPDCMTSGCAVGWAGTLTEFKKEGFKLEPVGGMVVPIYKDASSWVAVHNFFDLDYKESMYLFDEDKYEGKATPKEVATRIRDFVRNGMPSQDY